MKQEHLFYAVPVCTFSSATPSSCPDVSTSNALFANPWNASTNGAGVLLTRLPW